MTTTKKRRGRRSLAAMLMASVLAVVAGSPAHAANTSFEVFGVDTNNDGVYDAREFADQDRYDAALKLATNFARSKGGLGAVPAVFLASGETLVDSISVAGLAGYVDAPILLTPTDSLHGGVRDFIEDYGVSTVYVLGGSAAISDAAETADFIRDYDIEHVQIIGGWRTWGSRTARSTSCLRRATDSFSSAACLRHCCGHGPSTALLLVGPFGYGRAAARSRGVAGLP